MKIKRALYLTHRWLGVVLCLFMAMWFLSGVVMMYVGYPKLKPRTAERVTVANGLRLLRLATRGAGSSKGHWRER